MDVFLRGLLRDLERRATILRERILAVPDDPDVRDHRLSGYRRAESLRREAAILLADPSLGQPALLANHLRLAQELERRAGLIEFFFVPFLERYAEQDRRLTHLCRLLTTQVGWSLPTPLVLAFSAQYYWTQPYFGVIAAPATEGVSLLRLPDMVHELGHILEVTHRADLVGTFDQELIDYIDQELRRVAQQQRPPEYRQLYNHLFAQWRDAWLAEFVADMVAAYLVGSAYAWQHIHLCVGEGQVLYAPALGQSSTHPANEARFRGILAVLVRLGAGDVAQLQALWHRYLVVRVEAQPPDYDVCYPQALLDALAQRVITGCQTIGLRDFQTASGAAPASTPDVPRLLIHAWEQFLRDSAAYAGWEDQQMTSLWSALGFI
jgi:hypothetical protein